MPDSSVLNDDSDVLFYSKVMHCQLPVIVLKKYAIGSRRKNE